MFRLDGKIAMVTGAATGLGAAISRALASQGADIAICDLPGQSLSETGGEIRKLGRRALEIEMDVRELPQLDRGVTAAREVFGRIDILVNNAGVNRPASGLQATPSEWDDHFAINVKGGFFLTQRVVPMMIEQKWGRVIFISSQSGLIGIPGQPIYCSTKGAIIQVVRTLGLEWAKQGITVNSVAPTFVETNLTRKRLQNPEFLSFVLGKIPAGKLATPSDIGAAVAYLASVEASMVNCHTLCVDGGWTAW
jgi:NAD(P)-dependent dehydrogenase (short-subunit alcohol dehydrogenase family)